MRAFLAAILALFLVFVLGQIWIFYGKDREAEASLAETAAKLRKAEEDSRDIRADYEYFLNPANMEKELRARFNFINPGEKTIILVPGAATTTN